MFRLVRLPFGTLGAILRSRPALVAENLALRHQLAVLLRSKPAQLHYYRGPRENREDGSPKRPKPSALPVWVEPLQSHLAETGPLSARGDGRTRSYCRSIES